MGEVFTDFAKFQIKAAAEGEENNSDSSDNENNVTQPPIS